LAGCIIGRTLYEGKMTLAEAAAAAEAGSKNLKHN
jgi:phosphoribosylformimino-5-aminoimidazole carboxamide ribonucleotide (ProFAR) isomerase